MWIRSQNRTLTIDMDSYYLAPNNTIYVTKKGLEKEIYMATYSTNEKGLKVLDMIQKNINELNYKEPSWKNNYVFQMPQDAEVKE